VKDQKKAPDNENTKDNHLGATEEDVKPIKTPTTSDPDKAKKDKKTEDIIDPQTELTPG
jgi:hypothetical protein